jgi:hypothetical protein
VISEAVVGAFGGGLLRLAPELLRFASEISERRHEERLQKIELEFVKKLGRPRGFDPTRPVPDSTIDLLRERYISQQVATAIKTHPSIAALAALVRPGVTFALLAIYALVRVSVLLAGDFPNAYTSADMELLAGVLSFWFLGRIYERPRSG